MKIQAMQLLKNTGAYGKVHALDLDRPIKPDDFPMVYLCGIFVNDGDEDFETDAPVTCNRCNQVISNAGNQGQLPRKGANE